MKIKWVNHASFIIESGSVKLLTASLDVWHRLRQWLGTFIANSVIHGRVFNH